MLTTPYKVLIACSALLFLAGLGTRVTALLGGGAPLATLGPEAQPGEVSGSTASADRPDPLDDLRPPPRRVDPPVPTPDASTRSSSGPASGGAREVGSAPPQPPAPAPSGEASKPADPVGTPVPTIVVGRRPGEAPTGSTPAPTPAAKAPAVAGASPRVYVVQPGDSLERIAGRTLGDPNRWGRIAALNPGVDPLRLQVGDRLNLPPEADTGPAVEATGPASAAARIHEVEPGDSLSVIALRYYGDSNGWKKIYEANRDVMSTPDGLQIGTTLRIP